MDFDERQRQRLERLEQRRQQTSERLERQQQRLAQRQQQLTERLQRQQERLNEQLERTLQRQASTTERLNDQQQRIIAAALELLDEEGLSELSMRKVATKLGMKAPALYWHFKNKEVLVDHLAEAILAQEFAELTEWDGAGSWQDWLIALLQRLRRAMLAHPDGARVVAGAHLYPAVTLARLSNVAIASLERAGLDIRVAREVAITASHYTFGHVIEEQAAPTAEQLAQFDLKGFLQPYPRLAAALAADDWQHADDEQQFTTGLRYILRGATTA